MFSSWKNSRFYIWISLNVDVKFPLHRMLVYVNCGHFRWKLSLASQPPWFPSPPPLSPARTSSPRCSPAPCRSSCTWTVDMCGIFWQPLLHRWLNFSVWQGKTETEIFNPSAWIFSKEEGLVCFFGFLVKSRTDFRFPYLVTLSPQNSVITVCPVTPSTFVHIIVNFCTYQLQPFYISIKTIVSYFNHCTMWVYRHWFDLHLHCILNWAHHHTLPKFSQQFELCI